MSTIDENFDKTEQYIQKLFDERNSRSPITELSSKLAKKINCNMKNLGFDNSAAFSDAEGGILVIGYSYNPLYGSIDVSLEVFCRPDGTVQLEDSPYRSELLSKFLDELLL